MVRNNIPAEVGRWLGNQLFEHVPSNIVVINQDFEVVVANSSFIDTFGEVSGKHCYEVFKKRQSICDHCMAAQTFVDGQVRVANEYGIDRDGRQAYSVVHNVPIHNGSGDITYVIEMSYDVTDVKSLQRQYNILFERVPCYVAVLDRELKIVRANELLRTTFGDARGQHCYRVYKHRYEPCEDCPAVKTFADGNSYTQEQVGIDKRGALTNYVVSTSPLSKTGETVNHVVEMSVDVTESHKLTHDLLKESYFRHQLTETASDAIVATDASGTVNIFNPAAEELFGVSAIEVIGRRSAWDFLPADFRRLYEHAGSSLVLPETMLRDSNGDSIPVRFSGTVLGEGQKIIGGAAFLQDLRAYKKLQKEKLTNERLAVVGQTVAQLSHGMKNILTGVQGGLYGIRVGVKRSDMQRIHIGRERLERNVARITGLVRGFLNYTKEHIPEPRPTDINRVAEEVFALYQDAAGNDAITLRFEPTADISPANVDPDDIHTCLANLVSNGIDACKEKGTQRGELSVTIRTSEADGAIALEVADTGCGMDKEIREKVLSTFFTTKGLEGTGLGLLVTRKLASAHGGTVTVESEPGQGSLFRIELPRDNLPAAVDSEAKSDERPKDKEGLGDGQSAGQDNPRRRRRG
jgi:PAS domain S-box-containing protein